MFKLICIIIGYAVGCVQTAYYVAKISQNIDIREHGSGNAGTANITRVVGAKAGIITFVIDVLKGIFVFTLCSFIFDGAGTFYTYPGGLVLPGLYGGLGLVLGHNHPIHLKFKGGKGIAPTLGLLMCLDLKIAVISYGVGLLLIIVFKYFSLASLSICFVFMMIYLFMGFPLEQTLILSALCIIAFVRHKENIKRLVNGTERKFSVNIKTKE